MVKVAAQRREARAEDRGVRAHRVHDAHPTGAGESEGRRQRRRARHRAELLEPAAQGLDALRRGDDGQPLELMRSTSEGSERKPVVDLNSDRSGFCSTTCGCRSVK